MKVIKSIKLTKPQITSILTEYLGLPADTVATYNLNLVYTGALNGEYQTFGNVELTYEVELDNVKNKQGSPVSR